MAFAYDGESVEQSEPDLSDGDINSPSVPDTVASNEIEHLRSCLRGALSQRDESDPDCHATRRGTQPNLIVRCLDVADVFAAVNFAHDHSLAFAIRGGGDVEPGPGASGEVLRIDISPLKGVHAQRLRRALSHRSAIALERGFHHQLGLGRSAQGS